MMTEGRLQGSRRLLDVDAIDANAREAGRKLQRLPRRQPDDRRHAGVPRTFLQFTLFLDDANVGEVAEGALQNFARVELLDLLGSTGAVLELPWCIALHDQQPAALERAPHACPFLRPLRRRAGSRGD